MNRNENRKPIKRKFQDLCLEEIYKIPAVNSRPQKYYYKGLVILRNGIIINETPLKKSYKKRKPVKRRIKKSPGKEENIRICRR